MRQLSYEQAVAFFSEFFRGEHHIPYGYHLTERRYIPWSAGWAVLTQMTRPEDAPEALGAILAHLGIVEVVRG